MPIPVSQSYRVKAGHDGTGAVTFRLKADGVVVATKNASELGTVEPGYITFDFPAGQPAGTSITYDVEMVDAFGTVFAAGGNATVFAVPGVGFATITLVESPIPAP